MDPIRYTLSFTAPHTHYVEVRAQVPTSGRREVELMMAVWTPGSYLIREYERHVENVAATGADGALLTVSKTAKNRWAIETGGAAAVTVGSVVGGGAATVSAAVVAGVDASSSSALQPASARALSAAATSAGADLLTAAAGR